MSNDGTSTADKPQTDYAALAVKAFDQVKRAIEEGVVTGENKFDQAYRYAVGFAKEMVGEVDHNALHAAITAEQQNRNN